MAKFKYYDGTNWVELIQSGSCVTSVGISMPTGFSVSSSPVTSSGTIDVSFASGYSLPTTAKQTEWDAKVNRVGDTMSGSLIIQGEVVRYLSVKKGTNYQGSGEVVVTTEANGGNYNGVVKCKDYMGSATTYGPNGIVLASDYTLSFPSISANNTFATQEWVSSQGYLTADQYTGTVKSVNSQSPDANGAVTVNATQINAYLSGTSGSTDTVQNRLNDLKNSVNGMTTSYAISSLLNPPSDIVNNEFVSGNHATDDSFTLTYTYSVINGLSKAIRLITGTSLNPVDILLKNLKVGDSVFVTDLNVPDRWVSSISDTIVSGTSNYTFSITFSKLESYNMAWSAITGTPTTIAGYGITDVGNGTLSIQGNGTTASTFTANQSGNTTLNIKGSGGTTVTKSANNEITVGIDSGYKLPTTTEWSGKQNAITDGSATIASISSDIVTLKAGVSQSGGAISNSSGNDITLAKVAKTGSYSDLGDKPTIPTVNNATLTIQKNGTTVNTFTANASSDVTANISVPTKDSDITNDRYVRYDVNNQGLNSTQQSNARTNIGAGTSNFSGNYNDLSNKPTIPTDTNQTVKTSSVTFGADDAVQITAGGNITVTGDATAKTITIGGQPDTKNTAGIELYDNHVLHLIGATDYALSDTSARTYTNRYVYIDTDNCLRSDGYKVINTQTETKNTAGATNNNGTKMWLIASPTSDSANPQTYENSGCYIGTDNCLYSNSNKTLTTADEYSASFDYPATLGGFTVTKLQQTGIKVTGNIMIITFAFKLHSNSDTTLYNIGKFDITLPSSIASRIKDFSGATVNSSGSYYLVSGIPLYLSPLAQPDWISGGSMDGGIMLTNSETANVLRADMTWNGLSFNSNDGYDKYFYGVATIPLN